MNVAFGLKAHSGWAALVVIGAAGGAPVVVDRQRLELMEEPWHKHVYHAAEKLKPEAAQDLVKRGIDSARRLAVRELRAAVKRESARGNVVKGCAVLVGAPMPDWTVEQIISVHFRMHKAEGVLFKDALARAAEICGLGVVAVAEKQLAERSAKVAPTIAALGKSVGPPWGKDQKEAAAAAWLALR